MDKAKLKLTRVSYLINAFWYLEILGFITFIGTFLTSAIIRKQFVVMLPVDFSQYNVRQIKTLNDTFENARLDSYSGVMNFHVQSSLENVSFMAFIYILIFSVILAVTYQLKGIFENFKHNQHFTTINIKRLRVIAIVIILAPIIRYILSLIVNQILFSNLRLGPFLKLLPSLSIGFLITGLLLLMIIEIFKIGVDLEEENKLTV
ncbi:hypothetical protein ADIARSV_2682 [Arcticibacter svalbardensis MN12-7]|uniref:DUF2975 domain-containing protein n=1 Tax=Arcticibacter svalbardensis MN12-7 TaxID=1150600 RepID=R9GR45_9SPHI|nr:DUF2975 domain-containing protein [Arcticibacter svalbardensis]EOR94148.1 hypothetical protein ADIARSV_2682 [Arcticibacter svalbardensis MN12-7]